MGKVANAADALNAAFQKTMPLQAKKPPTEVEWAAGIQRFQRQAREIREQYKLGVFARAATAYRLQQRLITAGYPASVARQVVFALVLNVFVGQS